MAILLDHPTASPSGRPLAQRARWFDAAVSRSPLTPLSWSQLLGFALGGVAAFHAAQSVAALSFLIVVFLFCVAQLARVGSARVAFYTGLAVGLALYGPQLDFFWTIFGLAAVALWLVLAFWIGLFAWLVHLCGRRWGTVGFLACLPMLWTACEYFRSELYYLRFSWLGVGYAFTEAPLLVQPLGAFGGGFLLMLLAAGFQVSLLLASKKGAWAGALLVLGGLAVAVNYRGLEPNAPPAEGRVVRVAGVQLEFPGDTDVLHALDRLVAKHPEAELLVLSEYTFDGPVPDSVKNWCRKRQRYLIVGGKDPAGEKNFYDTAFVVGPAGEVVFKQGKAVPIQFFNDGLPAPTQQVWDSPWGKLGLCVCYDLSYTRVIDELIRQGAQALIVPTMDLVAWGRHQHELHARVAPIRAAECGVPIFRVASSGISQLVDHHGRVVASAPFPGPGATLAGELRLAERGRLPLDRWLAPGCVAATALLLVFLAARAMRAHGPLAHRPSPIAHP
jgi:apolipoprotein N-acyltransferase